MSTTELVTNAFTELVPRYEDTFDRELKAVWGLSYKEFVGRLLDNVQVRASDVVLDMATGTAQIPMTMAGRGSEGTAIGLDITPAMLRRGLITVEARGLKPRVKLVCASAMRMPFVDGLFDTVICGFGTHHMEVQGVLCEARRVLKKGGRLVMAAEGMPPIWRFSGVKAIARALAGIYGVTSQDSRVQAELASIPNLRTASEWRSALTGSGFCNVAIVANVPGRRRWYPSALTLKATRAG